MDDERPTASVKVFLEYLDSGKHVAIDAKGEGLFRARLGPPVGYWDGED